MQPDQAFSCSNLGVFLFLHRKLLCVLGEHSAFTISLTKELFNFMKACICDHTPLIFPRRHQEAYIDIVTLIRFTEVNRIYKGYRKNSPVTSHCLALMNNNCIIDNNSDRPIKNAKTRNPSSVLSHR